MNYTTAVFLINKTVRAVTVSYEPDASRPGEPKAGTINIFKTLDQSIRPMDMVVIPTDTRWHMTVGRVESVDVDVDFDSPVQMKWVVSKVDRDAFNDTLSKEGDAIAAIRSAEVRRKREELAGALLADNEALRALPIASSVGPTPIPPPAPQ